MARDFVTGLLPDGPAPAGQEPSACDPSRRWLPIATAPRDGTVVAILGPYLEGGIWESKGWFETAPADRRWYDCDGEEPCRPTHWRPLDAPTISDVAGADA